MLHGYLLQYEGYWHVQDWFLQGGGDLRVFTAYWGGLSDWNDHKMGWFYQFFQNLCGGFQPPKFPLGAPGHATEGSLSVQYVFYIVNANILNVYVLRSHWNSAGILTNIAHHMSYDSLEQGKLNWP